MIIITAFSAKPHYHAVMTRGSVAERIDSQHFAEILLRIIPDLPQPVVESLWSAHEARCYSPAEFLLREGEASQGIFLMISGLVRLSLSTGCQRDARVPFRELQAPAILGVNDALIGSRNSLNAQAVTDVATAFVPKRDFQNAVRQFPSAGIAFSHLIAEELNHTYSRISELRATGPA